MCCGNESVGDVMVAVGVTLPFEVSALLKRRIEFGVETYNSPPVPGVPPPPPEPPPGSRLGEMTQPATMNAIAKTKIA
jgi:hypothetical protein